MFTKQIKVAGEYVRGMIKNNVLITSQLVAMKSNQPFTANEIQNIIEELQKVKEEMEK